jgi:flagellar biosynthetic protein FliR
MRVLEIMPLVDYGNCLLVFLRASAFLAIFPVFAARVFPVQLRLALGLSLAILVAPALPPSGLGVLSWPAVTGRLILELLVGLVLGFASRMIFFALDFAGGLIGSEMSLNLPAGLNPFGENQVTAPALILYQLAAVLFLSLDMHHWLLVSFQRSYLALPIGAVHLRDALLNDIVSRTSETFSIAFRMAAPFVAVSFVASLVFSVLGRAVTQMNVFAESFAVRTLAGLVVFGLTCQILAQHLSNYLRRLPEDVLRVAQLLGQG